ATHGQTTFRLDLVPRNARLLWDECLPWALSARAWHSPDGAAYVPWDAPPFVHGLELAGALVFVAAITAGGAAFFSRRARAALPPPVRVLGLAGAAMFPVTIAAFLVSPMVMDAYSMRYLAAIVYAAPFALAPLAAALPA